MLNFFVQPSVLSCFLLAFLLFAPSQLHARDYRSKVTIDLLNELCSKTNNPSFCSVVLKLNLESTLPIVAQRTLDLAHDKATTTLSLIGSLIKKTTDPELRKEYVSCYDDYDKAIGEVENGKKALSSNVFYKLGLEANHAIDKANRCRMELKVPAPNALLSEQEEFKNLCNIIYVISNYLFESN
ncbi:pectinesterase inhibitor 1-like [Pistacia vera]|uniref:pectinesterase inhibitor 1-like n=1 Tax=Pistacia vera TaxID=55513 RepID=UPI001263DCC8|nr:pectinesterase inhibitor 1-like [Pistacia vera]